MSPGIWNDDDMNDDLDDGHDYSELTSDHDYLSLSIRAFGTSWDGPMMVVSRRIASPLAPAVTLWKMTARCRLAANLEFVNVYGFVVDTLTADGHRRGQEFLDDAIEQASAVYLDPVVTFYDSSSLVERRQRAAEAGRGDRPFVQSVLAVARYAPHLAVEPAFSGLTHLEHVDVHPEFRGLGLGQWAAAKFVTLYGRNRIVAASDSTLTAGSLGALGLLPAVPGGLSAGFITSDAADAALEGAEARVAGVPTSV